MLPGRAALCLRLDLPPGSRRARYLLDMGSSTWTGGGPGERETGASATHWLVEAYVPFEHGVHVALPPFEKVPRPQAIHDEAPSDEYWPGEQA